MLTVFHNIFNRKECYKVIMLSELKEKVYEANMDLWKKGMVIYTWGNVSGIDRDKGLVVIKPSGVDYDAMRPEDMVVVDLNGNVVEGKLRPSSDTPTHIVLYKEYGQMGGIVHIDRCIASSSI